MTRRPRRRGPRQDGPKASALTVGPGTDDAPISGVELRNRASNAPLAADVLIRELNHRVKNNFQIIVSLLNLRKRMIPPERREDLRFIEEHVQSMSVAYRLAYATGFMIDVSLTDLIGEVVSGLRQIAGLGADTLRVAIGETEASIGLDHAIALALYLAVLLPPYLDEAGRDGGVATVSSALVGDLVTLSVGGSGAGPIAIDFLRERLMQAYAGQLMAQFASEPRSGTHEIRFVLESPSRP
jgi:hypothetical protein